MKPDARTLSLGEKSGRIDNASVRSAYRRYAGVYDVIFGAILDPGRRKAVGAVNGTPNQRILEVGVGTGLALPKYRSDVRVTGIDLSAEMLDKARRRVEREGLSHVVALHEMDAGNMQFAAHSFDTVVLMYSVSVVPDLGRMFKEIRRVCVPGGEVVVVNHFTSSGLVARWIEKAVAPLSSVIGFRTDLNVEDVAEQADMEIGEVINVNVFGYWKLIRFRNKPPHRPTAPEKSPT